MEQLILKLNSEEMEGLPLYYNTIYYNSLVDFEDEEKNYRYDQNYQGMAIKSEDPRIDISKTIDYIKLRDEK